MTYEPKHIEQVDAIPLPGAVPDPAIAPDPPVKVFPIFGRTMISRAPYTEVFDNDLAEAA